jgi:hypothetical protein
MPSRLPHWSQTSRGDGHLGTVARPSRPGPSHPRKCKIVTTATRTPTVIMVNVAPRRRRTTISSLRLLVHPILLPPTVDGPKHLVTYFVPLGRGKALTWSHVDLLPALGSAHDRINAPTTALTRTQAAGQSGHSSRRRCARPSRSGRARPGASNRGTRRSAARAPPRRCRQDRF